MARARRNLCKRRENESALGHPGMRDRELGCVHGFVTIQQNVQVNEPRAVLHASTPAQCSLNFEQCLEQISRRELRLNLNHAIEKPRLLAQFHRFSLVKCRLPHDSRAPTRDFLDRARKIRFAVADIRSKG